MKRLIFILFLMCATWQASWGQVNTVWAKGMGGGLNDYVTDVEVDGAGNVYTLGSFMGTVDFDPNAGVFNISSTGSSLNTFLQKLDANGDFIWAKNIGNHSGVNINDIKVTPTGDIYLAGRSNFEVDIDPDISSTLLITGNFLLKLNTNASFVWVKTLNFNITKIDLDNAGNVYGVGGFTGTVDFDPSPANFPLTAVGMSDVFIAKLDSNGNFLWAKSFGGSSNDAVTSLEIDGTNHVYLAGGFSGIVDFDPSASVFSVSTGICFVEKLNSNGDFVWVRTFGTNIESLNDISITDINVDANNDIFMVGRFRNTQDFDPGPGVFNLSGISVPYFSFISKLSNTGNFLWAKSSNGGIFFNRICLDNNNNIYLTGFFNAGNGFFVDFDYNVGTYLIPAFMQGKGFIQKLDNNANFIWVKPLINGGIVRGLFVDNNQFVYFAGSFQETVNFDINGCVVSGINLTSMGLEDAFVAKLAPTTGTPTLSFEPALPTFTSFSATCVASVPQTFQVKGENLWGHLVVSAPAGYEISLTTGGTYSNNLNLNPACGTVLPTTIFIRLKAGLAIGTYNGNITLSSTGATSQNVAITGTVQASSATATIALASSYCLNSPTVTLSATPSGGNFTIDNASASVFNPATLGLGEKIVKYNFFDANGCLASTTLNVMVNSLPTLSNNVNLTYGSTQTGFTIVGLPAGSTYTVNGTPVTEFIPSTWGAGTHTLIQTATINGCTNTLTKFINITEPPTLTSTAGATCWTGANISVDANMTVTGATPMTGAIVNFGAGYNSAQDRLIYPTVLFGVTGTFNVATGVLALVGNATTAQYQQIFRSIQYQNISATPNYGATRTINFTAGDALPLYPCGSADAHFYKFVPAPQITWQNAKLAAEGQNYFGLKGYLATILCVTENNFAFNSIGQRGWIGASDDAAFTSTYSPNGEGQWYWVTGPEAGTRFWQGLANGTPIGGFYNNWEAGEPNNFQNTNESFAHILENGRWNDYKFNDNNIFGYYIEFGGLPTDPSIQNTTSTKQIRLATKLDFAISPKFCENVPAITLVGTPSGGTFKVNGNVATTFNPSILGVGNYTITYELAGCTIPASKTTVVNALPAPAIVGLNATYCADVQGFTLTGIPTGGTFTINGSGATEFNPVALGAGNYTVVYSFTNAAGCSKTTTQDVLITPLPTPEIVGLDNVYCISEASVGLSGTPTGGIFQINNQNATVLDPQALGAGKHIVSYKVTNAQNCTKTTTQEVEVLPLPALAFVNVPDAYCSQASAFALEATPSGGTFMLNGVPSATLNPADFAVGDDVTVDYEYISPEGCENSISKNVSIIFSSSFVQTDFEVALCPAQAGGERLEAITLAEEQALIATNGQLQYAWSNGAKTRFITLRGAEDSGIYKVTIKSNTGCPLRDFTFKVQIKCETKLSLPTAFTPNGDGKNDVWEIFGEDFTKLDLRVYNRWGELVFISNDKNNTWDGRVGGKPAPAGVYAWTVSYANPLTPQKIERQQGRVTVLY